jgi:hypothetical protein
LRKSVLWAQTLGLEEVHGDYVRSLAAEIALLDEEDMMKSCDQLDKMILIWVLLLLCRGRLDTYHSISYVQVSIASGPNSFISTSLSLCAYNEVPINCSTAGARATRRSSHIVRASVRSKRA